MTQLTHPDVIQVVDALDTIGQKYRVQRFLRGLMLFTCTATLASLLAGMIAHLSGAGLAARLTLFAWIGVLVAAGIFWVIKPLLIRPRAEWVARLIEQRIAGLNNGLTNLLKLSERDDLQSSPFTPLIYSEIRTHADAAALGDAVKIKDLSGVATRCGAAILLCIAAMVFYWTPLTHGWRQMLAPSAFVPRTSSAQIVAIRPGDATIIRGQPLEILIETENANAPTARLLIDGKSPAEMPSIAPGRYGYRVEHVDQPLRYRVEVSGTESRWFDVKTLERIGLQNLWVTATPPGYTKQSVQKLTWNADKPAQVTVAQGSTIEVLAQPDAPVAGASLQLGEQSPGAMRASSDGAQFAGSFVATQDASVSVLLTDASGQILARLPEPPIDLRVTPDAPPTITLRWPTQDLAIAPDAPLVIKADLKDDLGLSAARVLIGTGDDASLAPVHTESLKGQTQFPLAYTPKVARDKPIRVQIEAVDNRALPGLDAQITRSPVYEIRFSDPSALAKSAAENLDKLRAALQEMLKTQQGLHDRTGALKPLNAAGPIRDGQTALRDRMTQVADTFAFEPSEARVKKTLQMLVKNPAQEAIDLSAALIAEPDAKQQASLHADLQTRQRRIISTLESLLAMLNASPDPVAQTTKRGGDLESQKDALDALKAALQEFIKQQQKILDQTAPLAKKPVDDFTDKDKKALDDLAMSQEKLDAFIEEKIHDFSKLAEQDMANASLLKELMEIYSEVTMAKDALKKQSVEIAVAAEQGGVELAKSLESNLEKWLPNSPDRIKWTQEELAGKTDVPMAELPNELEDMIGELMEQQEDLLEDAEDMNANIADSLDKGAGWDAMDGPIANMSAKGVTGNTLPNNNEMNGRSGEGRSGKSQGEFVEDSATGKGGRNTPTRLDPTAFQQGQITDTSKDPVGGATGGGKLSGQGGEGLEGPTAPGTNQPMQRLAQKQSQLRNAAERLNLQYQLGHYDNFKLLESIAIMRRVESDLASNRYQNAMYRKDHLLDALDTSRLLVGGEIHVQHDTSPALSTKMEDQIHNAMKGDLPPAWSEALKTYYQKLGRQD